MEQNVHISSLNYVSRPSAGVYLSIKLTYGYEAMACSYPSSSHTDTGPEHAYPLRSYKDMQSKHAYHLS